MRNFNLKMTPRRRWSDYYRTDGERNVIFCPSDDPAATGTQVRVRLMWPGGPQCYLSGVVIRCRRPTGAAQRLRPGATIRLHPGENGKIQFIRDWVGGHRTERRHLTRLPIRLAVIYKNALCRRVNCTRNINASGILLNTTELVPRHVGLSLDLHPPGGLMPIRLRGTVVRHIIDAQGLALGIRLDFQSSDQRLRFARLSADLDQSLRHGNLEDCYLSA